MPSPYSSPVDREPAPFDPKDLSRSVIAIPLLEAIKSESDITEKFLKTHGHRVGDHNAAVFYRADLNEKLSRLHEVIKARLDEAVAEARATRPQRIDPPLPKFKPPISLARLDGPVITMLLAIDAAAPKTARAETPEAQGARATARRAAKFYPKPIIDRIWPTRFEVIIDINLYFKPPEKSKTEHEEHPLDARRVAKEWIKGYVEEARKEPDARTWIARYRELVNTLDGRKRRRIVSKPSAGRDRPALPHQGVDERKTDLSNQYVFAQLEGRVIEALVAIDQYRALELAIVEARQADEIRAKLGAKEAAERRIDLPTEAKKMAARFRTLHHIWPDFTIRTCITDSISTVKVDAAHRSFTALGKGITWAVADSGIDAAHPHFRLHKNIDPASPYHADFTKTSTAGSALEDGYGHGTHVAGIIAGEQSIEKKSDPREMMAVRRELVQGDPDQTKDEVKSMLLETISGMAPKCELVSLKVLDRFGQGRASNVITAIDHIQAINHNGRELHIHGVNLSLGYPFDPKWFACGHSPLCVEVNRLVKSGVVVVVAAGNSGYGTLLTKEGQSDACLALTINDPGNAEYAITVGSTHRDMPHLYGVSYFSSKGPTGDGRYKPDLLAPGEKIISCAVKSSRLVQDETGNSDCFYFETSGTSMAAPHVSGAIAAFLSIRREFIGDPQKVKAIFTSTATDLGRDRYFQGAGLVDLMRAIQSV